MNDTAEKIIAAVDSVFALEKQVSDLELEISKNEQFRAFLAKQKEAQAQISETWKIVEQQMIEHDIKSLKGDWGSLTIAERTNFKVDLDNLPTKFVKKVADTTKIATAYKLDGKLPKGVETSTTKYLTKRIK